MCACSPVGHHGVWQCLWWCWVGGVGGGVGGWGVEGEGGRGWGADWDPSPTQPIVQCVLCLNADTDSTHTSGQYINPALLPSPHILWCRWSPAS
jgi:hypothetical protein